MKYIAQHKPRGCRNWRDVGRPWDTIQSAFIQCACSLNGRVRILEIPDMPTSIAAAFYSEPRVVFDGQFVSKFLSE